MKLKLSLRYIYLLFFQGQVMFRNGERMGTIKFNQFQGTYITLDYSQSQVSWVQECEVYSLVTALPEVVLSLVW